MVTDQNRNIYEGAAGVRELGKQTPMDLDTVFAIFSTTKAIVSVCALQLLEEGLLRLDDPAGKYLPEMDMSIPIGLWETSDSSLANSGEFMPGVDKGWSHAFMINREKGPTGRSPGSMAWAGLANCYLWIDKTKGIGGYWATQILPFYDCSSYPGFYEFEATTYNNLS